jgi:maltooligosyltrehalose trehalohydrolase
MSNRFYSFGAQLLRAAHAASDDVDHTVFRLWAPSAQAVSVLLYEMRDAALAGASNDETNNETNHEAKNDAPDQDTGAVAFPMQALDDGWYQAELACGAGTRYRFECVRQDGSVLRFADPASRRQHCDVHDVSVVVDPDSYHWQYPLWRGRPWCETVLYELHVGVLGQPGGGFAGVEHKLPELAALGITAIELMPIADFPGTRNWGYDGVLPYAPDAAYGTPEQLKALIDTAHGLGMMVFLDVVYNHFGPDGNYLGAYAQSFFRDDIHTPWGQAIDFRQPAVRSFFTENALYWLREYRFDGLRFDAVHAISEQDWLVEMGQRIRSEIGGERHIHLVLENDDNAAHLLGYTPGHASENKSSAPYDAQWNDDGHHVLHTLLTGEREHYYRDYCDHPAKKLARCLAEGFVYQGEPSPFRNNTARGEISTQLPTTSFVLFLQNHDQIGNRAFGERLTTLARPSALRAAMALVLLSPQIPLLFMGEEVGATAPFLYFTSYTDQGLAQAVRDGRRQEFVGFAAFADPLQRQRIPDPNRLETYAASIPHPAPDAQTWQDWVRTLLAIRHDRIMRHLPGCHALHANVLGEAAVCARWQLGDGRKLVIAINLSAQEAGVKLEQITQTGGTDILFDSGGVLAALGRDCLPADSLLALLEPA